MARRILRPILAISFAVILASCASKSPAPSPSGAGPEFRTTIDTAIHHDASNEIEGARAEHAWTAQYLPGWRWETQSLINGAEGRVYDLIELGKGGETKRIYFDITAWFGKLD